MSDGRILSILNSALVQNVQSSNTTSSSTNAPPGNQSNLLPGGVIRGEVIGRDSGGNPILRTAQGTDITIRSETFLKYGNQVVIRIDQTGAGAKILSIDGQSPQNANPSIPLNLDSIIDEVSTGTQNPRANNTAQTLSTALQTEISEAPDSLLIRSALLSKAPSAPSVLNSLPASIRIPLEALQPGTQVLVRLAPSVQPQPSSSPQQVIANEEQTTAQNATQQNSSPLNKLIDNPSFAKLPQTPVSSNAPNTANTPSAINFTTSQTTSTAPANSTPAPNSSAATPSISTTSTAPALQNASTLTPQNNNALKNTTPTLQNSGSANTTSNATTPNATSSSPSPQNQSQNLVSYNNAAPNVSSSTRFVSAQPASTPNPSVNSQSIAANFLAFDANGDATFQSPLGILKMPQGMLGSAKLTPGTSLLFQIAGFLPASSAATASALPSAPYSFLAESLGTLDDIFTIVRNVNPQVATELMNRMPQTGGNFTSSTMFFISAMLGGDIGKFLGGKTTAILEQQGKGDLIRKLGAEFSVSRSESQQGQNWQLFYVPLLHEQEIHPVRLYVKKDKKEDDKNKKNKKTDTRFVIEVNLSELGEIQLDGFIKHKDKHMQFDLMLRTLQPLLPEDEKAIFEIYNNAAQIAGFTGNLNIQLHREFPVKPMDEMLAGKEGSITA